ncbi:hypothetical protein [Kumtagia ephedrae]|uniref:DUF3329 domain-containing protein n=1 Tax=Kumtagia ephedrae TaxID=2116701 RepID=A0A2P7SFF6_9HYPH|nr:hypothetical protein [Mesorhizobium ephedrae]PSJ61061.1 hypothetical protein C7I84_10165 [Mesorhizobium ephedrae]
MTKDTDHPFLRPLWRRVALVVFCAAWAVWEFSNGETFWGTLAAGMAVYGAWIFVISYKAPVDGPTEERKE